MQVYAPHGTFIEGNGVKPDIELLRSRAETLAGPNVVLEVAIGLE